MTTPWSAARATRRRRLAIGRWLTAALVAANLVGVGLYVWWASHAWIRPQERAAGVTGQSGEAAVWAIGVLPLWASFGVVNAVWAIAVLVPPARWRHAGIVLAVGAVWAIAVFIDFAHH